MSIDEWFKEFGKNTTSNLQLVKYCKKLKIHNVVICMRDELTNVSKHTKNIIMNLEDNNGNGSHWVCIFNSQDKYYFDSFGLPPPVEVIKFLQNGVYQTFPVQELIPSVVVNYVCMCYFNSTKIKILMTLFLI